MKLDGLHAVVTGGGTGIGAAVARALSGDGARVTLIGRRREPLEAVANEIGGLALVADAADRTALDVALDAARARFGPFAIAIANAGSTHAAPFERTTYNDIQRMMSANLATAFNLIQATLPDLRAAPAGRIVAVASTAALKGYAYCSAYAAAKHALAGLVRSIAVELARTGVTANAVCPGFTDTPIAEAAIEAIVTRTGRGTDDARASLATFNPQGRLVAPEEVAATVAWLCHPSSGAITGQAISVSGGETA